MNWRALAITLLWLTLSLLSLWQYTLYRVGWRNRVDPAVAAVCCFTFASLTLVAAVAWAWA